MKTKIFIGVAIVAFLVYLFRNSVSQWIASMQSGQGSLAQAASAGYTTYNKSFYLPPFVKPLFSFGAANPNAATGVASQPASYSSSVQG